MNLQDDLQQLAHLYGVQTSYHDALGQYREAGPEALLAILAALDAPLERGMADVGEALRARREELDQRLLEPALVAWEGGPLELPLRLTGADGGSLSLHVDLEDGGRRGWSFAVDSLPVVDGSGT
ncbi:MAG TPA: 4-alpha-glucanotransferase, partial [Thermoanaerobaculia bacterium]|nr:4-alpha-glucanotransferase [Thermoanaerobaculia bacterium]